MSISNWWMTSIKKKRKKSLKSEFFEKYPQLDPAKMPAHVAIIMDGNGRWAKKRLFNRVLGHEQGVKVVVDTVRACHDMGIQVLTLYAFSTENWQRPQLEVTALMFLLKKFLKSQLPEMMENHIRMNAIGQTERLPDDVRNLLYDTMKITENHREMQQITHIIREPLCHCPNGSADCQAIAGGQDCP
jgi:undecaprenyl diphosphate synthase